MFRAGTSSHFWSAPVAGHLAVFGTLFLGLIPVWAGALASENASYGESEAGRGRIVTTALDAELVGPLAYNGQKERASNGVTSLDAALNQLRKERASLSTIRNSPIDASMSEADGLAAQRDALKQQINGLMSELARRPKPEPKPATSELKRKQTFSDRRPTKSSNRTQTSKSARDRMTPVDGSPSAATQGPVDPMALAQALFRTGDYHGSLKAFNLAKKTATAPRDRNVIKYLSAACLKKLGNVPESTKLFREVANSKADDVLAECAQWQLSVQQWREATIARIEQLRATQAAEHADSADPTAVTESKSEDQGAEAVPQAE